jgi:Tfp pilus assembly protein PilO
MRRASRRERLLLIGGFSALALFLLIFFLLLPMRDTARALALQEKSLTATVERAQRMYREMPAAQQETKQLRSEVQELFRPEQGDVQADLLREIAQLTSDLGVRLTSIRPGEPEPLAKCVRYPVGFRVETDFPHLVRLLYELEQRPHRLWVEGVEVGPGAAGGSGLLIFLHAATYQLKSAKKASDEKS